MPTKPGKPLPRVRPPPRRPISLGPVSAQNVWVNSRVAASILEISNSHLHNLRKSGEIRHDGQSGFNLADVLERYRRLLRVQGAVDDQVEAICIREFEGNLLPQEIVIKHGFGLTPVMSAWTKWTALRRDPDVARILSERGATKHSLDATRCPDCLRTAGLAAEDTARLIPEITYDPKRTSLTIAEERELAAMGARCRCGELKATVPIELMRFRLRALRKVGETPPPVEQPALTDEERIKALCTCSAAGDPQGDHADACVAKQYVRKAGDAVRET